MFHINIEAGDLTEELVQYITGDLDDETLDQIEVKRRGNPTINLVSEPITVTVAITTISLAGIVAVTRLIERWMENQKELETIKITAATALKSTDAAEILAGIANKHAEVAVAYGLVTAQDVGDISSP